MYILTRSLTNFEDEYNMSILSIKSAIYYLLKLRLDRENALWDGNWSWKWLLILSRNCWHLLRASSLSPCSECSILLRMGLHCLRACGCCPVPRQSSAPCRPDMQSLVFARTLSLRNQLARSLSDGREGPCLLALRLPTQNGNAWEVAEDNRLLCLATFLILLAARTASTMTLNFFNGCKNDSSSFLDEQLLSCDLIIAVVWQRSLFWKRSCCSWWDKGSTVPTRILRQDRRQARSVLYTFRAPFRLFTCSFSLPLLSLTSWVCILSSIISFTELLASFWRTAASWSCSLKRDS